MWTDSQKRAVGVGQLVVGVIGLGVELVREFTQPPIVVISVLLILAGVGPLWRIRRQRG